MSAKPVILDLCCGGGGAGMGYKMAGFDVVGLDIMGSTNRRYPAGQFIWANALDHPLEGYDAYHASPPCQAHTPSRFINGNGNTHVCIIREIRERLEATGKPYVIENVPGSPLRNDPIRLCGTMFPPLRVYRHRLFETNWPIPEPPHPKHVHPQQRLGEPLREGEWPLPVGDYIGGWPVRHAMGIDWFMPRRDVKEAIPPLYTKYVGEHLMKVLK